MKYFKTLPLIYNHIVCKTKRPIIQPLSRFAKMSGSGESSIFCGKLDIHNSITVVSSEEPCNEIDIFSNKLKASLEKWHEQQLRAVWFQIEVNQVQWIPILIQEGFKIHHGLNETITLVRWLAEGNSLVPHYAHNIIGAGAVVMTDQDDLLIVQERYREIAYWKLPGGTVDPGEDIVEAAQREVLEETNIKTEFISIVSLRHSKQANFGCSDIYFVVALKPLNKDIIKQDQEIDDCKWIKVEEFLNHPMVHENNRLFVRCFLENRKNQMGMTRQITYHPITQKPQTLYKITKLGESC